MSQSQVADAATLDQGHYSRIERGLLNAPPTDETIGAIASVLKFPVSFFKQNDELSGLPLSVHDVAWRKKASVNASDMKRLHAELNLRVMNLRRYLNSLEIEPELTLPRVDADEMGGADKVASFIRRAWMIPDGPIKNLTTLCERAGILVIICNFVEKVDGVTMRLRDVPPIIFLNQNAPADRIRHSLAHELGHLIMHAIPSETMEEEADLFAGELLTPTAQLRSDLIGGRVTLERLVQLKKYWKVSVASLLYRSGHNGLISKNQSDYLWRQLSARGWRKREPEETQFPHESTRLYDQIIALHKVEFGYSCSDFAAMLHLNQEEVQNLYGVDPETKQRPQLRVIK
ncbi:MAG: ImmA/IrrE family metallo-endopeptidase [Hyphomicrobiales bacterium]|nr:ImmA/IrrE family metallo-endopeptidase [Hyphomicrobiales bacterium]MDE2114722.1 ImmA/IrrE family metallo-endopeptidase [Hyphomicrobiales bacterium]